ncbi:MAG: TonB-dependent receptor [Prolixibacteraceae bacterium]|nr:TonB-dependent receptor [Prolixibacteraceae bacterium]
MRITVIFICFVGLLGSFGKSYSQNAKLSLEFKNSSIESVLNYIESRTEYSFMYDNQKININREVNINMRDETVGTILNQLFENSVNLQIIGKHIIITPKNSEFTTTSQQSSSVSGKVTDSSGSPLPGVSVVIKGITTGVITDSDGKYTLSKIPENAILQFSFVGMKTQEIPSKGKATINVTMIEEAVDIEEVVAIGYGTKLKGELTGSISKFNSDKIESRPVSGTMEAIQGMVPGITVTREGGKPGRQNYSLKIRGASSINGNVPLVLVDGIPGDIGMINPEDIESLTVLKDAAAAIYGARAADGVVLITTKKGEKSDHPIVSYSYNLAFKKPSFLKNPSTTEHFVKMFNEANANDGDSQTFSDATLAKIAVNDPGVGKGENWGVESYPMFYQSQGWYHDIFETSLRQTHNLSVSGGTDYSNYIISAGYLGDNGNISVGENFSDRYNLRLKFQSRLTKNINLDLSVAYDDQVIKEPSQVDDAINNGLKVFSYVPYRNPAGRYYTYQGYTNPFQELEEGGSRDTKSSKLSNNFKLDWEPIKGLVWTGQAAVNIGRYNDNAFYSTYYSYNWDNQEFGITRNSPNSAYYSDDYSVYKNFNTYLNYNKVIKGHSINLMAGASREKFFRKAKYIYGADFTSNEIFVLPLSNPKNLSTGDYWDNNSWALLSYFGRASYSYNGKYYIDGTFRKDGSSKFSPEKRWSDIYPSVSLAWKISEEPFFKSIVNKDIVNLFKTRVSWGKAGNQDISALGLFDYIQLISIGGQYPIDGSTVSKLASMNGIASPSRTWETIETKNLGFDFGLFNSKLTATFDIYQKENKNMLVSVAYPSVLGASAPTSNAGTLLSKGWELTGNWNGNVREVQFNLGFIVNYNKNRLTNLQGQDSYNIGLTTARQGYPLNSYFGYKASVIRTKEELDAYAAKFAGKGIVPNTQENGYKGLGVGDVLYEDIDGDGQITAYGDKTKGFTGDAVFLGSADPKLTYGINAGLKYKNFDFGVILQGTGNKYSWRGNGNFGAPLRYSWFQPLDYFYGKTFTNENSDAQYPRLSNNGTIKSYNYQSSSIYLENTKYLRVKNITVGYTFHDMLLSKLNLKEVRIYLSGQDIFEFTKGTWDKNYDPEENASESNYPMYRTFSCGINVHF